MALQCCFGGKGADLRESDAYADTDTHAHGDAYLDADTYPDGDSHANARPWDSNGHSDRDDDAG